MRQRLAVGADGAVAEFAVQGEILEPEELAQVIAPGGPLVGCGGRRYAMVLLRIEAERFVHLTDHPPVRAPVLPFRRLRHRRVEVVDVDAVGDEARPPVMGRDLDAIAGFHRHVTFSLSRGLMAWSRLEPRSSRRIAAQLRPGRPETDPPGCVQAPVWYRPATGVRYVDHPSTGRK